MGSKSEPRRRRVAGWIGFPGISLVGVLKLLEWLFSLGGAPGNAEGWRKAGLAMLSVMPSWLMPALLAGSSVALVIYLVGVVPELYGKSRHRMLALMATLEGIERLSMVINIAMGAVAVALLGGLIYYLVAVYEPTKMIWTHPSLSVAEQQRVEAECRMRSVEVLGGGLRNWNERHDYVADCKTSRGFESKEVKR